MTARRLPPKSQSAIEAGVKVITLEDIRWKRCDIKTVSLLPNILGKQKAREQGAYEAWMVDENQLITEGTSTNAWIVSSDGALVTSELGSHILSGVTRKTFIQIAAELSVEEAENSREAFFTSSTSFLTPVTEINGKVIGNGKAGSLSLSLLNSYFNYIN